MACQYCIGLQMAGPCAHCSGGLRHQQPMHQQQIAQQQQRLINNMATSTATYRLLGTDSDYELFKKYAHLSDGELLELFQDESAALVKDHRMQIEQLEARHEAEVESKRKTFWDWCAKYRKHLTPERAEKLKIFT